MRNKNAHSLLETEEIVLNKNSDPDEQFKLYMEFHECSPDTKYPDVVHQDGVYVNQELATPIPGGRKIVYTYSGALPRSIFNPENLRRLADEIESAQLVAIAKRQASS